MLELALQRPQHIAASNGLKKFITAGEARAEGRSSIAIEQTGSIRQTKRLTNHFFNGVCFQNYMDAISIRLVHHSQTVMSTMPLQRKDPLTLSFRDNTTAHEADDKA